jgi:hypothetical protein
MLLRLDSWVAVLVCWLSRGRRGFPGLVWGERLVVCAYPLLP